MSDETVRMPIDAIFQHASSVDRAAEEVEVAGSAAAAVALGGAAYGRLCQFLPAVLGVVSHSTVAALHASGSALHGTAEGLRRVAGRSISADHASAARARQAHPTGPTIKLPL